MNYRKNTSSLSAVDMLAHARNLIERRSRVEGLQVYRDLTTRYPNYVEGWFQRSGAENGAGNAFTAIKAARTAMELAPGNTLYRAQLAQLQVSYGLWGDALETLSPLREHLPGNQNSRIENAIGAVLSLAGLEAEAQPWFESAAKATPSQRDHVFNSAQGLLHCGRLTEAEAAFDRLLQSFPDFAKAHWSRATLNARQADEQRLTVLRQALVRAANPSDEVFYCFALFTLLDAMDRRREAFTELEHGMKLQRALMRYAGEDVALLRRLGQLGTELGPIGATASSEASGQARPLFIVGLPRSGTTLVERVLSNHPDVAQGGELICFSAALRERFGIETPAFVPAQLVDALTGEIELADVGARYLQLSAFKHHGHACFTDKLPFNFMLVPWIARALPQARFLHVQRDPMDTCFSNLKQLFSRHYGACYSQRDMAEYYLAYYELMQTWDRLLPGRVLQIKYEALVADPEEETRRMLDFCGLDQCDDAWRIEQNLKPVATASAAQVRDPINARSIGGWRRYEQELRPLSDFFAHHPQLGT